MADAFELERGQQDEFAIYDAVLQELATTSQNVPLGASDAIMHQPRDIPVHE